MSESILIKRYIVSRVFNSYSFDYREKHNYQKSILLAVKYQLDLKMIKRT